jgi:hypothetical protein
MSRRRRDRCAKVRAMSDPARVLYRNAFYDGQLVRTLAASTVHAADLGESFATARRVGELSGESCYRAWSQTADIACPTLIIEAENDFAGGGGAQLQAALTCPSDLLHLTAEQGAEGHRAGLGQELCNDTVYSWLAPTLAGTPTAHPGVDDGGGTR